MWDRSQRATTILVLGCSCLVLLAASAHLLHPIHTVHSAHNHGKTVADVDCALCALCIAPVTTAGYQPSLAILQLRISESGGAVPYASELLRTQIARAPPFVI